MVYDVGACASASAAQVSAVQGLETRDAFHGWTWQDMIATKVSAQRPCCRPKGGPAPTWHPDTPAVPHRHRHPQSEVKQAQAQPGWDGEPLLTFPDVRERPARIWRGTAALLPSAAVCWLLCHGNDRHSPAATGPYIPATWARAGPSHGLAISNISAGEYLTFQVLGCHGRPSL